MVDDSAQATADGRFARVRIISHALAGLVVFGVALTADAILGNPVEWGPLQTCGIVGAAALFAIGLLVRTDPHQRVFTGLCIGLVATVALLAAVELGVRQLDVDFAKEREQWEVIPTYFQKPIEPTGEVYFRRPGPHRYVGQVLNTRLQQLRVAPNPFSDERVVTIDYDGQGFRNASDLKDWEIAVVGDSFTELGNLTDDELHTTILSEQLGVRVKNVGVSQTGSLTHVSYLEDYGLAPGTRHWVVIFFGGNDPLESMMEHAALKRLQTTGQRELRDFERQPSILLALYGAFTSPKKTGVNELTHAYFQPPKAPIPLTLFFAPRDFSDLPRGSVESVRSALDLAFDRYAALALEHGITPWLAYMPCKLRVHYGQLEFTDLLQERVRNWQPSNLPDSIRSMCEARGIRFLDLAPALVEEAQGTGRLLFNTMYDTHLNAAGARVVAFALAEAMREAVCGR